MKAITLKIQRDGGKRPLTIIVGVKVSPKATERNKIKRRIRAIMRDKIKDGKEYVIIAHPEAKNISFQELKNQIEHQL